MYVFASDLVQFTSETKAIDCTGVLTTKLYINPSVPFSIPHRHWQDHRLLSLWIKLWPKEAHTCARPVSCCCDLDINAMTLKLGDTDILKMYLHIKSKVARLRYSKLLMMDEICMANENIRKWPSRSKVKVKCHQFPITCSVHHEAY